MSYQVLARKWRPKTFAEMVGQQHVLKALINALENNRLHHAYLFTGTRGVGKTTVARIFAKSLNCEKGVSANPCGECASCVEVDEGRFVDLIEVDAASRTKVEDTRELLENVQYAPTRGRYKVYLIDEVHMLSTHSFNALLKTLEEPPPHVKFLLATTDPQKLPVTILSRCLQFNLKNMTPENVVGHLKHILAEEQIPFEEAALWQLGRAADGSMRDALSLTDQAIAYGEGQVNENQVSTMLGTMDRSQVFGLLTALSQKDAAQILAKIQQVAEFSPDFQALLTELISVLHRVAIAQLVPDAVDNSQGDRDAVVALAGQNTPEDVQLFYQIALTARKDLHLAPDLKAGFEMALLRMLAFSPKPIQGEKQSLPSSDANPVAGEAGENPATKKSEPPRSSPPEAGAELTAPTVEQNAREIPQAPVQEPAPVTDPEPQSQREDNLPPWQLQSEPTESEVAAAVPAESGVPKPVTAPAIESAPSMESGAPTYESPFQEPVAPSVDQAAPSVAPESSPELVPQPEPATQAKVTAPAVFDVPNPGLQATTEAVPSPAPQNPEKTPQSEPQPVDLTLPWPKLFWHLNIQGMPESLFGNSEWLGVDDQVLSLRVATDYEAMYTQKQDQILLSALQQVGMPLAGLNLTFASPEAETPFQYRTRIRYEQRMTAIETLKQDVVVQALTQELNGELDEASVQAVNVSLV